MKVSCLCTHPCNSGSSLKPGFKVIHSCHYAKCHCFTGNAKLYLPHCPLYFSSHTLAKALQGLGDEEGPGGWENDAAAQFMMLP
jgi:hypothetical protein